MGKDTSIQSIFLFGWNIQSLSTEKWPLTNMQILHTILESLGVLVFYLCRNELAQNEWLKTTWIYDFTVLGVEAHYISPWTKSNVCAGLCFFRWALQGVLFFAHSGVGRMRFKWMNVGLKSLFPCWLSPGKFPHFLWSSFWSLHKVSHIFSQATGQQIVLILPFLRPITCLPRLRAHVTRLHPLEQSKVILPL